MAAIQSMRADAMGTRALADMVFQTSSMPKGVNQSLGQIVTEGLDNANQVINAKINAGMALEAKMRKTMGGKGGLSDTIIAFAFNKIPLGGALDFLSTVVDVATTYAKCHNTALGCAEDYKAMAAQIGRHGGDHNDTEVHFDSTYVIDGALGALTWRDSIMPRYRYCTGGSTGSAQKFR